MDSATAVQPEPECSASGGDDDTEPWPRFYGQPGDHKYTAPAGRVHSATPLRTAKDYEAMGGTLHTASSDAYRTHKEDADPIVATFENVLSTEEIAHIKEVATPKLRRAGVTTDAGTGGRVSQGRTNDLAWVPHDTTPIIWGVISRIAEMIGLEAENAESLQVIRYAQGQKYNKHTDAYDPTNERGRNACRDGGNRIVTALIYLSEVEAGGETGFINMRFDVQPKVGRLLLFHNCYEGTCSVHPDSLHSGKPVIAGEKWACNLWFRERATAAGAAARRRREAVEVGATLDPEELAMKESWAKAEEAEKVRLATEAARAGGGVDTATAEE